MGFKVLGFCTFPPKQHKLPKMNFSKNILSSKYIIFEMRGFMSGFLFAVLGWPFLFCLFFLPFHNRSVHFTCVIKQFCENKSPILIYSE